MQTAMTRANGPGRVLLVDDHPAVRRVLRSLLEEVGGWEVVGEADSGEAALPLVEQLTPDVVLMDCRMPGQGGVAATREIVRRWPEVAVVAHTAYADETYVREMVAAGARGYVLTGDVPAAVLEALAAARQGQARLSAAVTSPVMEDLRALYEAAVNRSRNWRPRTPTSAPRWPASRSRPAQGRVPGHGQPRAPDPDHGRPRHGPDPGRAARHGRHRRRAGNLHPLHPARRLHHPAGRRGRPRPVPGRPPGQGHGWPRLGGGQPGRRRLLRGRAARPGPGIVRAPPGTARP